MLVPRSQSLVARFFALSACGVASLILAAISLACFPASSAAIAAEPTSPAEVRIGYFANVTHAQAVLGVASGDFQKAVAPAKLTTHVFNAGPSLIEALFAGEIDIGYVGPGPALNAHVKSRGKGLRVVAGAAANGVVIVARPGSGITRLEDLKGKRIATPQLGNTQDISARHYLLKTLGQADADNVMPVPNAEQAAMMERGQIDAAWAVEPWGSRLIAEAGATVVAEEKDLWPGGAFSLTLVVVSVEFLEKHPDVVRRLLEAHCAWTARLSADASTQAPALGAALEAITGKALSQKIIADSLKRVRYSNEPLEESLRTFARWTVELGMARSAADVKTLVDTTILKAIPPSAAPKDAAR